MSTPGEPMLNPRIVFTRPTRGSPYASEHAPVHAVPASGEGCTKYSAPARGGSPGLQTFGAETPRPHESPPDSHPEGRHVTRTRRLMLLYQRAGTVPRTRIVDPE